MIDISDLDEILEINNERFYCIAEPGATFEKIVNETLKYNLVPAVVPELKTITIGGGVSGCSIESMSYKFGGFHDNCLEYEIMNEKGEAITCTPENENKLLFQMVHGTFGTLGIITKIKFKLMPASPYVKVSYERYENLDDYKSAIWKHYKEKDIDFMDGIIHNPNLYILSAGNFVDKTPYTNNYDWMKIYYVSTAKRKEDYLKTEDYFFRYNKGVTNVRPKSLVGRIFFGKIVNSTNTLKIANKFKEIIPEKSIPVTVDTFIPYSSIDEFMDWYIKEINHFPLWCVPYKIVHKYEWLSDDFIKKTKDELFLDIALYGLHRRNPKHYYRLIEEELMDIHAVKTLISSNYYSEDEFWSIWNKENYTAVKKQTDPENVFNDLYKKMCSKF